MTNAGIVTNFKNGNTKELFLDENLKPIIDNEAKLSKFKICFIYESQELKKIHFISYDSKFKSFEIEKHFIKRYFSFNRSDEEAMEMLRNNSLNTKSLISLKRYAFECIQYI